MSIEERLLQEFNERDISSGRMYRLSNKVCDTEEKLRVRLDEE